MSSSNEFLWNMKEAGQTMISTRRPWGELFDLSALSLPSSLSEATTRMSHNASRFLFNYGVILVFVVLLSLVYHPFAIILFLALFAAWYFLYFSRDEPLNLCNLLVLDDRPLLLILGVLTLVALFLANVWLNLLLSLAVGLALLCLHAAFRGTEDLVDHESPYGPMLHDPAAAASYAPV